MTVETLPPTDVRCESCATRAASRRVRFQSDGEPFDVCDTCAPAMHLVA